MVMAFNYHFNHMLWFLETTGGASSYGQTRLVIEDIDMHPRQRTAQTPTATNNKNHLKCQFGPDNVVLRCFKAGFNRL